MPPPLTVSMPVSKATSWAGLEGEHVLPDPVRGQQNPLGLELRSGARGGQPGQRLPGPPPALADPGPPADSGAGHHSALVRSCPA